MALSSCVLVVDEKEELMPNASINPQDFKTCLHDAVDIGKEPATNAVFPFIAVTIGPDDDVQAYGRSQYAVGWSFSHGWLSADHDNTVLITWDEAKELGMAVGKTSAAKDATVWVDLTDGRLTVEYGAELVADLAGVDPQDGDIEAINEEHTLLCETDTQPRRFFAMGIEVVKRFSKIRGKTPYLDLMFTDVGNTTLVKIGDGFIGAFEAIDRARVDEPKLFED